MKFVFKIIISSLAVMVAGWVLPGVEIDDYFTGIAVALILAFLNAFLRPILVVLTLPVTVLSLGLFLFVINALLILLVDYFLSGFYVDNFWWALLFSLVLSIVTSVFEAINGKNERTNR
ncbi:phage holin family protein [Salibacter sp.]|jgi:putative membrane protein|uniref:phage holin family protein n=1 Tax=Salibacter sp. TaxID=2010995 RepID=UPI00287024E1|nr:phage holin family protein [Salibacter sp.]MDR9399706.1 phage holin family protein [Salibacter sp.]MDR9488228.1 phage holin family protein [Salibacter sp.]